jgi:hypothetical protein
MNAIRKGFGVLVGIPLLLITYLVPMIAAIVLAKTIGWSSGHSAVGYFSFVPLSIGAVVFTAGWWIRSTPLKRIVVTITTACGITEYFSVTNW